MDLRMPNRGGVAAIVQLPRTGVRTRVLVLTTYDTDTCAPPRPLPGARAERVRDEVLELVDRVTTNREGAAQLFISDATVKTHLLHIS